MPNLRSTASRLLAGLALVVSVAACGASTVTAATAPPAAPRAPTPDAPLTQDARLAGIADRAGVLAGELFAHWRASGPDLALGGFYGTLDRRWQPTAPTDKGLIQQARQLWSMTLWYERREPSPAVKALADHAYRFLQAHFRDTDGEYFFKVTAEGTPVNRQKVLYAESFAIYALTAYGRVFHVPTALSDALTCFRSLDARAHDATHGGYHQRGDTPWLTPGAEKETNTHLHLLESFSALYEATRDATVGRRLNELLEVFAHRIVQRQGYAAKDFLDDWTPYGPAVVSYGHDLETAWLLLESSRALGRSNDPVLVGAAVRLAATSAILGFDREHGGFFEEGPPGRAPTKTEKIWWIQAEALPGLFTLYLLNGDEGALPELERTLDFLERHQRDQEYGGLYWGVTPAGEVGPHGTNKAEEWKASYHELRALVLLEDWIRTRADPRSAR